MRRTLSHWMLVTLIGLSTASTGCRSSGWGLSTPSWLSWGGKPSSTSSSSALASRPSTQLPPSPSATMAPNGSYAGAAQPPGATTGAAGYPNTPYARNYATQQASTAPGYHTGPYNTGAPGAPAATGAYGAGGGAAGTYPSTSGRGGYPSTGGATPAAYGAPQSNYGAPAPNYGAATGYGTPGAAGGNANSAPTGNAYSNASPVANYGALTPQGGSTAVGGQPNAAYAPPPAAGLSSREGGYRPGSTGRSVSADGAFRAGPAAQPAVQPADYQSGTPTNDSVPEYTAAPAPPPGYGGSNENAGSGGTFIPPGGQ